jgi:hypothetical protein
MNDVNCPYCGKEQEINHDDGYGYVEDRVFEQECWSCGKVFTYTTSISFYYETNKAPCKNGGKHKWKKIVGFPVEHFENKYRCEYCDDEKESK